MMITNSWLLYYLVTSIPYTYRYMTKYERDSRERKVAEEYIVHVLVWGFSVDNFLLYVTTPLVRPLHFLFVLAVVLRHSG